MSIEHTSAKYLLNEHSSFSKLEKDSMGIEYANRFLHLCFYLNLLESWSKPRICVFCGQASWLDTELLVKVRGIQNISALYLL